MKKYSIVNFKSPVIYLYFFMILSIAVIPATIIIKSANFWMDEMAFMLIMIILLFLIYTLTGKVITNDTSITKRTLFGARSLKIEEIRSFAVYKQYGGSGVRMIEGSELIATDWTFPKTIIISTLEDFNPMSYKQKGTIRFHYQKDLYLDILQKIKSCKHSRYA